MINLHGNRFKKIGEAEYEMEKDYCGSDLKFFSEEKLLSQLEEEVFIQARNVAQLPGLAGPVCIMPDSHSGYGAPIGTVFAMDSEVGYVSPGAVGYDINCGMRLITTNLVYNEIKKYLEKLLDQLFFSVTAGVGRKGFLKVGKEEFKKLVEGGVQTLI